LQCCSYAIDSNTGSCESSKFITTFVQGNGVMHSFLIFLLIDWPMLNQATLDKLHALRLTGMAEAYQKQLDEPEARGVNFEERFGMPVDSHWTWAREPGTHAPLKEVEALFRALRRRHQLPVPRTPDARSALSHAADTVTGSKPVDAAPGSDSSPRSKARRHLNTWFAFTPCALATSATLAPGSSVSSTIRRFSATDRHLRTRRSAPDPSD
jgi:hypothetical protein